MARILVVDDDDVARKNMERLLTHHGFEVSSASSAAAAKELIKSDNFDVVVSDLVMENDKAGLNVLKAAKDKDESIEVIIITAYGNVPTAFDSSQRGAFAYIEKDDENPYDLLCAKVKEALEKRKIDVFLCYNREDEKKAIEIGEILKQQGIRLWSKAEVLYGRRWQQELEKQLDKINSAVILIGRSRWEDIESREKLSFIREFIQKDRPVIPVILEDGSKDNIPHFLREIVTLSYKDFDPIGKLSSAIKGKKER